MIGFPSAPNTTSPNHLHAEFLTLVPKLQMHAMIHFRDVRCADEKADKVAEAVALGWKWYRRLQERGKDVTQFSTAFAFWLAKAVRCGRRLCGQEKAKDVLSRRAQRQHGFTVEALPCSTQTNFETLFATPHGQQIQDAFEERLHDNMVTPIPDQAAFRIDFRAWLRTLTSRERRILRAMIGNEKTKDLSRQFQVSGGRISQIRREFERGWHEFVGDAEPPTAMA
jgi:hypothetical protein